MLYNTCEEKKTDGPTDGPTDRPTDRREKGYLECDHPDCIAREEKIKKLQELVRAVQRDDYY